jgi:ABC-type dipeptide/oligopeptide/nickel transport system ATPase component
MYALYLASTGPGYQTYYDTKTIHLTSFDPRCPLATAICRTTEPPLVEQALHHTSARHHTDAEKVG